MIDLSKTSKQPPVLAGFESASALPDNLSEEDLASAPDNRRFKSACGEMLCVNGWCFVRPTDKTETDFPYHSLAVTKRMLCPGGLFAGPPDAAPTYHIVPSDLPTPGMSVADVMDE